MTSTASTGLPDEPDSRTSRRGHKRRDSKKPKVTGRSAVTGVVALAIAVGTGFATVGAFGDPLPAVSEPAAAGLREPVSRPAPPGPAPRSEAGWGASGLGGPRAGTEAPVATLPGLGPKMLAQVPFSSGQVLIASGKHIDASSGSLSLWTRTDDGLWERDGTWVAHNGLRGWSHTHRVGDLRSPVGVFSLSDAGGLKPNPGARLPYHRSPSFAIDGEGFLGEPLAGTFDHVVAIDYNRVPGTSPLDARKPLGPERGGGIWLHVDHGGPTQGCVTIPKRDLVALMRALDPDRSPVIVMGDRESLAR